MDVATPRARVRRALAALLLAASARAHAPHDVITEVALSPAFATDRTVFATVTLTDNDLFARSTDAGRSWTYIGTPLARGGAEGFGFSPDFQADGTAFAANTHTGLWRTQDAGLTWQSVTPIGITLVRGVAVSPDFAVDRRVLAATGVGTWLSTDGGTTWVLSTTGLAELDQRRVAYVRDAGGQLTAFSLGKILHRSLDGGLHWTPLGGFPKAAESFTVSPDFEHDQRLAVSFGHSGLGVAYSSDGGSNFQFVNDGLTDLFADEVALAQDGALFAATETAGCFRAELPGAPWQLIVTGFEEPSDLTTVHNTEIVPSPAFATDDTIFAGTYEGMYRSYERGDSWRQLDVYSQLLNRCFALAPGTTPGLQLLAGNYGGGVFHYVEHGAPPPAATRLPGTVGAAQAGGAAAGAPSGPPAGGAAPPPAPPFAWDVRSTGIIQPWSSVLAASPGPVGGRTLIWGYITLFKSTDEGRHWVSANSPPGLAVVRALAFSPDFEQDSTVFMGTGLTGSFRSDDGASTWTPLPDLPPTLSSSAICVSPAYAADRTLFYASRNFGIWRSQTGGNSFAQVGQGLLSSNVKSLALSPEFVTDRMLLAGTTSQGVWASFDAGETWREDNAGLPPGVNLVESIAFSPDFAVDRTVFVALQDLGVWRSTDGAQTWQPTGPGLLGPPVRIEVSNDFVHDHTLFAGTFGGTCVSRDAGATWKPLAGYIRKDDRHPSVQYEGPWVSSGHGDACCSTLTVATTSGAATETEFRGSHVEWIAQRSPDGAIALVQIDDGEPTPVDTWSQTPEAQVPVFVHDFADADWHVIRVTHSGTANPASSGFVLRSDGFAWSW